MAATAKIWWSLVLFLCSVVNVSCQQTGSFPDFNTWSAKSENLSGRISWKPSRFKPATNDPAVKACVTQNVSETCSWAMGSRFFKYHTVAPMLEESKMKELTFLIIDSDGGALRDTEAMLKTMGVVEANIFKLCPVNNGSNCKPDDTFPEYKAAIPFFNSTVKGEQWMRNDWQLDVKNLQALGIKRVDVVITISPGHHAILGQSLGSFIIVRFMARWQQGFGGDIKLHVLFGKWLRQLASCGNGAVAASNAYDWMALKHYLGIDALPWPSTAGHVSVATKPEKFGLVFSSLDPYESEDFSGFFFLHFLLNVALGGTRIPLKELKWLDNTEVVKYQAVVLTTYAVQVSRFVEVYMSGLPVIAPGLKLLTDWHKKYRYMSDRTIDGQPNNNSYNFPYSEFLESRESPCCGTDPEHEQNTEWLQFVDHLHWKHVVLMDDWKDINVGIDIGLNYGKRSEHVRKVRDYASNLLTNTAGIVSSQIAAFLQNARNNDVCTVIHLEPL